MKGNRGLFLIFLGILFVLLLSINSVLFRLNNNLFKIELIFFIFFLLFGGYLMINLYSGKEFVYKYLFLFFIINIINIFYIYLHRFSFKEIVLPAVMCLIGLYTSVSKLKLKQKEEFEEVIEDVEEEPVVKTFSPGKYIASKTGVKFHAPKCYWAKKISEDNKVWFNDKESAVDEGYKKCNCVE